MRSRRQRDFFDNDEALSPKRLAHGGDLARGKRKLIRPLDPRRPVHVTLRSSKAKGRLNFRSHQVVVKKIIEAAAARGKLKVHSYANVGNHLHLLISFKRREACQRFLREVTGLIARAVTGARKGKPFGKFWDELAYSRVVNTLRDLRNVIDYIFMNRIEGGFGREAREQLARAKKELGFLMELDSI